MDHGLSRRIFPRAHARYGGGRGKGRENTSGHLRQAFVSHRNAIIIQTIVRYFEHPIITSHCVISGNAKLTPNKLGGGFGDGPVMFSLRSTIAQAQ